IDPSSFARTRIYWLPILRAYMASVNRQDFRVVKPRPGERGSTRQTVVLNTSPQLAKTIVFFNYYCQAKTLKSELRSSSRGFLQPAKAGVKKIVPRRPTMRDTFS